MNFQCNFKLLISDDEEDEEESMSEIGDDPVRIVEYDSEENEVSLIRHIYIYISITPKDNSLSIVFINVSTD